MRRRPSSPIRRSPVGARSLGWLTVIALLALAMLGPGTGLVAAFNPGENGTPTSGDQTDLQGRGDDVTFTFQTNMTINCDGDGTAQQFNIKLDYSISGAALPAGSTLTFGATRESCSLAWAGVRNRSWTTSD